MEAIITSVTAVVTAAIGWMGQFLEEITTSPVLTIFCIAVPLCGLGVGLLNRMFRTN